MGIPAQNQNSLINKIKFNATKKHHQTTSNQIVISIVYLIKPRKKQSPQNKMAAEAVHQTFETETTLTTFEVKTMTTEVTEVVEMRNKAQPTNAVEDAIRGHFGAGVVDLIYWKDIKKSAGVAASSLILLISLSIFSVLSVISLAVLTVTFSFAVYKRTLAAIQKSDAGHPFGQYLEMDLSISPEKAQEYTEIISSYMATYVGELRRLVLVEDMIDSIKFGIL